jgi:AcrR family transcriptional regulator
MRIKTETRRNAIIEAATHVFLENGFGKTTMSDIAVRFGGSKATLYGYFSSKEELFLETIRTLGDAQFAATIDELKMSDDIRKTLSRFGSALLRIATSEETLSLYRLMVAGSAQPDIGRNIFAQGPQKGENVVQALLKTAIQAGQLRQCDTQIAADHLHALLEAEFHDKRLFSVVAVPSQKEIAAAVERALDVFLAAYGK